MSKLRGVLLSGLLLIPILSGCSQEAKPVEAESGQTQNQPSTQTTTAPEPTAETKAKEETKPEGEAVNFEVVGQPSSDAPADQGDPKATLGGELTINSKTLTIKGSSNLLPGAKVKANVTAKGYNMWGYNDETEVNSDGSFELEVKKPDVKAQMEVELSFTSDQQSDRIQEAYGKTGEKLTGDYVYQYLDSDKLKYKVATFAYVDPKAQTNTKVPFETPVWDKPSDYGQPAIWIKPSITKNGKSLTVAAKSNFLEGTKISGGLDIPNHVHYGYTDQTEVKPDGSFSLQIPQPDKVKQYYVLIQFIPDENMWPTVKDAYGEKGEKLKGEFIKIKDSDKKTVNMVEMKIKVDL
ncbi:hypothetical protein FB479_102470 [Brevibacillus sp. AG162]|uniref:hypothetical protein n=1 Tax=Brevibacillus sp. AG162 TaxID=2572910 RepID=UPI0011545E8C|nr:hypothetical protein [Brevibacillus sp. AG162]TQK73833.1 hypothetical protein FB479_102470 [Brevibacillus sp. AG162]